MSQIKQVGLSGKVIPRAHSYLLRASNSVLCVCAGRMSLLHIKNKTEIWRANLMKTTYSNKLDTLHNVKEYLIPHDLLITHFSSAVNPAIPYPIQLQYVVAVNFMMSSTCSGKTQKDVNKLAVPATALPLRLVFVWSHALLCFLAFLVHAWIFSHTCSVYWSWMLLINSYALLLLTLL